MRYFHCDFIETDESFRILLLKNASIMQIICYLLWLIGMLFYTHLYAKRGKTESFKKALMRMWKRNSRYGLLFYPDSEVSIPEKLKCKNIFISGTFEVDSIYRGMENELREVFKPLTENKENDALLETINKTNSVCVSMRKWAGEFSCLSTCDGDYYQRGFSIIQELIQDPVFVIFSDDVEWAEKWIKDLGINCQILRESGKDDLGEKMRLMSACKHYLISNSTFSWWAQYLGNYQQKVVVGPKKWRPSKYWETCPIIGDNWIKI